jgi:hypothetical protein
VSRAFVDPELERDDWGVDKFSFAVLIGWGKQRELPSRRCWNDCHRSSPFTQSRILPELRPDSSSTTLLITDVFGFALELGHARSSGHFAFVPEPA